MPMGEPGRGPASAAGGHAPALVQKRKVSGHEAGYYSISGMRIGRQILGGKGTPIIRALKSPLLPPRMRSYIYTPPSAKYPLVFPALNAYTHTHSSSSPPRFTNSLLTVYLSLSSLVFLYSIASSFCLLSFSFYHHPPTPIFHHVILHKSARVCASRFF